ncbi:MAG: DNA gyrase subunit A, partial [Anaerolineae bacterium]|nr:DNA gyrase subunit A [Anaerolineae bacterium]
HGKVYSLRTYQLPLRERAARGVPINSILPFQFEEKVTAALVVPDFEQEGYFTLCTRYGRIKRVMFEEFSSVRPSGLIAMSLDDGDELRWVRHTGGDDDLILVTMQGQSIRFNENDVRVMGRPAAGVNAIRLIEKDVLAGGDVISPDRAAHDLLVVTEAGYGKRTLVSEFRQQGRFGMGIRAIGNDLERTGRVIGAMLTDGSDDMTVITVNGITLRTPVSSINRYSRTAMGVRVMNIAEDDAIVSITLVDAEEEHDLPDKSNGHGDITETTPLDESEE